MRRSLARHQRAVGLLLAGLGAASIGACTEDTLTGVDPDSAPGAGQATVEIELSATELPAWRDTTYTDYALAATSASKFVAQTADIRARILARFGTLPDSVFVGGERLAVERFESGRLRLVFDTTGSEVPEAGGSVEAYALTRDFVTREATWSNAADGDPWTAPGGDLGELLGALEIEELAADTMFLPLTVETDSLLRAWRAADGGTGLALLSPVDGTVLAVEQVVLAFDVKPVGRDTLVETLRSPTANTFVFDPPTPAPGAGLRLGGLPAARTYVSFELPESLSGVELRGARINRATLLLTSTGTPPAPFATTDTLLASIFSLLSNPFEFGPKTPVGVNTSNPVQILPEDMEAGGDLQLSITALVQNWAASDPDSMPELNLGVRVLPEGGGLAYWEFGHREDPARAPRVRIVFTPSTGFDLP
ncbi:MAG TPA: hypothetical protein VLA33_01375 [Gemmatimonadota bacterium]|nr:hypothetical protein [Gemmatimonadota bacterium]